MEENKKYRVLLDFDGVCLTNENYPGIGKDIGAVSVLKDLVEKGHRLILWTRRDGFALDNALKWFKDNEIELTEINPKPKSGSNKIQFDLLIDDKALNMPLKQIENKLPYINWILVRVYLKKLGVL